LPKGRMTSERSELLLDRVFEIMAAEGFADLKMMDLARRLGCSPNTLYKLAPTKESLFALALKRWLDEALNTARAQAEAIDSPAERARAYYENATAATDRASRQLRMDIAHFTSTTLVWVNASERFVGQFAHYLTQAAEAGEVRPLNARFTTLLLQQIAAVARDEELVAECGLTKEEAHRQVELLIWEGISAR
jgi:AcrR family transcriptional regulator